MRVLLFGVDGLTYRILNPLIERGILPHFQRVRDGGVQSTLKSTVPPMTPPAWMSICTGLPPAKHGVYDFWEYEQTELGPRPHVLTHRKGGKAIWNMLSDWGKRVVVANVPLTFPPEPVNGIMLSGYMAPDTNANVTYPASFKEELLRTVPDYQIDLDPAVTSEQLGDVLVETLQMTRKRNAMFSLILSKPWEFLFITYTGADRIQHLRWDEIMASHPQAIEYYRLLDEALGMALDALSEDDLLMIVSDHGFQGAHRRFFIQEYLYKQGLLRMRSSAIRHRTEVVNFGKGVIWSIIRVLRMQSVADWLRHQLRRKSIMSVKTEPQPASLPDLDWANTHAWIPANSGSIAGYVNIFLDDTITEERISGLVASIKELRDPETGQPVVVEIQREDAFGSGPFAPNERHLVLLAADDTTLMNNLGYKSLWEVLEKAIGIHHPDGVLYLYGKGVKRGASIASTHVYDVVPTILSYFGLPLSEEFEGRIIEEAFEQKVAGKVDTEGSSLVMQKLKKLTTRP